MMSQVLKHCYTQLLGPWKAQAYHRLPIPGEFLPLSSLSPFLLSLPYRSSRDHSCLFLYWYIWNHASVYLIPQLARKMPTKPWAGLLKMKSTSSPKIWGKNSVLRELGWGNNEIFTFTDIKLKFSIFPPLRTKAMNSRSVSGAHNTMTRHKNQFLKISLYFWNKEKYLLLFESEKWKLLSHVQLFVTPWTIQSMEFSRPKYWSG